MRCLLRGIALLLLIAAPCTYAQTIPTIVTQADMIFGPSPGGDNQSAAFIGPGVTLGGSGDAACMWCVDSVNLSTVPGATINPSFTQGQLDWVAVTGSLTVGDHTSICQGDNCVLDSQSLTALRSFTFPSNSPNFSVFTVTVPAAFNGPIMGTAENGQEFTQFDLQIPAGEMELSYEFVPAQGLAPAYYSFIRGEFKTPMFPAPEPGPLGLMAAALAGLLAVGCGGADHL